METNKDLVIVQWIAPDGRYHTLVVDDRRMTWGETDPDEVAMAAGSGETLQEAHDALRQQIGPQIDLADLRVVHRDGSDFGEPGKIVSPDTGP